MTKKSLARLERDAKQKAEKEQLKNNTCWDDLVAINHQCTQLLRSHITTAQMANNQDLVRMVVDKPTLAANIRLLASDLRTMQDELNKIGALHMDKTGGSQDPDVVMTTIEIFEAYNYWMAKHDAVLLPTVQHMLEQFDKAEQRLQVVNQAAGFNPDGTPAEPQDPNVVDVVAKETPAVAVAG